MTHGHRLPEHAPIAAILAGSCLILFGRQLFWFFVAVSGFLGGMFLVQGFFSSQPEEVRLAVGILIGLLGAGFAMFFQKLAVGIAGFFVGGYLAFYIIALLDWENPLIFAPAVLIGGVLGAMLVHRLFDWALIVLSSLLGASLISVLYDPDASLSALILFTLLFFGVVIQGGLLLRQRRNAKAD